MAEKYLIVFGRWKPKQNEMLKTPTCCCVDTDTQHWEISIPEKVTSWCSTIMTLSKSLLSGLSLPTCKPTHSCDFQNVLEEAQSSQKLLEKASKRCVQSSTRKQLSFLLALTSLIYVDLCWFVKRVIGEKKEKKLHYLRGWTHGSGCKWPDNRLCLVHKVFFIIYTYLFGCAKSWLQWSRI